MKTQKPCFDPVHKWEVDFSVRKLPHWHQINRIYFVTFRLADSVPQVIFKAWHAAKDRALQNQQTPAQKKQIIQAYQRKVDRYLDQGLGSCLFKKPALAGIVRRSLQHFDGQRYSLDAFVIMPNHVHLLVLPFKEQSLSKILHSWKSYSANQINKALGTTGPIWTNESFDHIVRSEAYLRAYRRYIQENPFKAGLKAGNFFLGNGQGIFC